MKSKVKIALAVLCGALMGAGGQVMAKKLHTPTPPTKPKPDNMESLMQNAWREFDRSMAEQREAMQKLFAAQVPDLNTPWPTQVDSGSQIQADKDKLVIRVPIQDPHNKIQVDVKNGFLTVSEQAHNQTQQQTSNYNSVQSFSLSSAYDPSQMTQKMSGNTLIISIPKSSGAPASTI